MQDRITQLEGLVISLMSSLNAVRSAEERSPPETRYVSTLPASIAQQEIDGTASPQDPTQLSANLGRISLETLEANYVESSDWTAILDGYVIPRISANYLMELMKVLADRSTQRPL
jgi:hypothetical protein